MQEKEDVLKKHKGNPIIYLIKKMWKYSPKKWRIVLFYGFFIITNALAALEPLVIAFALNTIQVKGVSYETLPLITFYLAMLVVIELVFWAFHGPGRVIETYNAFLVRANYKKHLLNGVLRLPTRWHTDHHSGDTIDKVEKGTNALYNFSGMNFLIMEAVITFVSSYIALVYFNFHALYIVILMLAAAFLIVFKFDKILVKQYIELFRAENKIAEKIYDAISNITTVIILRIEKLISRSVWKKIMAPFELYKKNTKLNEWKWFWVSTFTALMAFFVMFSYIYFGLKAGSVILVGTVYALYGYVQRINRQIFHITHMYSKVVRLKTQVLNAEEVADDFAENKKVKEVKLNKTGWKKLIIQDLHFSYHESDERRRKLHLEGINMELDRGSRVALIGDSGSGKSTILKLIRSLYGIQAGHILLDGTLLKNDFKSISSSIALIPQEPEIFSTTIRQNVTAGVDKTDKQVWNYIKQVNLVEKIKSLPNGLDSSVVEKGVNLSGGEKQRLALARGIMASEDKQIVLFDEPTSSVDSINEMEIYEKLFKKFRGKLIISSVHRLHLLNMFDKIYYFEKGKIIASGTLVELKKNSSKFRQLYKKYGIMN